jgi:hypothetical protein
MILDANHTHVLSETDYEKIGPADKLDAKQESLCIIEDDSVKSFVKKKFCEDIVVGILNSNDIFPKKGAFSDTQHNLFTKKKLTKWDMGNETGDGYAYPHRFMLNNNNVDMSQYLEKIGVSDHIDCFIKTVKKIHEPDWLSVAKTQHQKKKQKESKISFLKDTKRVTTCWISYNPSQTHVKAYSNNLMR